jgi:Fe-S-cluster-containing dehydrogenase component
MVIDVAKCIACYSCFAACKDEYWENDYAYSAGQPRFGQFWMNLVKKERGDYRCSKVAYQPILCQHCKDAPCEKAAENGAVYRTDKGAVIIDPKKAVGQKQIADACPYGVVYWNEEKKLAQKCTMCAHRLEEGKTPRCVQICPSGCMTFGDFDDPNSEVSKLLKEQSAQVFHPEFKTNPNIYYLNLQKMESLMVAGTAVRGDKNEAAVKAVAYLKGPDGKEQKAEVNFFGDFEFDGLKAGKYTLRVEEAGYAAKSLDVDLTDSKSLGDIVLAK